MGFGHFLSNFIHKPLRVAAAVYTFGASEAYRAGYHAIVPAKYRPLVQSAVGAVASVVTLNPTWFTLATAYNKLSTPKPPTPQGEPPMAFNIGQFLGNVGTALGGSSNSYLSGLGGIAGFASSFVPQPSARPMMLPSYPVGGSGAPMTVSNVPAIRVGNALTKEIFDAGVKVLSRLGLVVPASSGRFTSVLKRTLASMASLARRTPAGTIVSLLAGIGLTAYESNLLVAWHSQRKRGRRMNPCNSKALRRAGRRIKSFHKLCQTLDTKRTVHHRFQKKCA